MLQSLKCPARGRIDILTPHHNSPFTIHNSPNCPPSSDLCLLLFDSHAGLDVIAYTVYNVTLIWEPFLTGWIEVIYGRSKK
jgi:hypothetical protein